jgi:K+-transporting ATPase KdpF subunit
VDGVARSRHLVVVQARSGVGASQVNVMQWIGVTLAFALGVYLFVALFFPEKFE